MKLFHHHPAFWLCDELIPAVNNFSRYFGGLTWNVQKSFGCSPSGKVFGCLFGQLTVARIPVIGQIITVMFVCKSASGALFVLNRTASFLNRMPRIQEETLSTIG